MIDDIDSAKQTRDFLIHVLGELQGSLAPVKERVSPEEYANYGHGIGAVVYEVIERLLGPLLTRHPELKPPDWE